ncbi:MAG: ABC transporter ATP-binding protein [Clostridia bacterium]|nr:ABC transporter ATP-binding protein [Clostridia bacterium]
MKKLLTFLTKYRRESILAPAFKLSEALMDLLVPLVVAAIINQGIANGDTGVILRCFLILILLAVLGMGFSFTAQWFAARASVGMATDLRQALFEHIQRLTYSELDSLGTDTLITRMTSDLNQVQNGVNLALRLVLRSPFIVFGAMIMAFTIDLQCALIFAVAIPVLAVIVFGIMLACIPLYAKAQAGLDRLLGLTRENLTGVRVIRAFCGEQKEIDEFDRRNAALTKMNEFVGRLSALMNPLTYLLINVATIFLIRQGALRVHLGALQQGNVVALYNYMAQIIVELIKLASLVITLNKSLACANRIEKIFDVQPSLQYAEKTANGSMDAPAVAVDGVCFTYTGGGAEALQDISFTAGRGETIGVIGGTGCGKTTLVNLIPRFYDVNAGTVQVDGVDVRKYPEGALIQKIGIVPQKAVLFEGTIRENMQWGNPQATDDEIWKAIDFAQAREVVEGKQGGLDAVIEQGGRNLSGGQRQRLCIARALVKTPEILILDDSASALDFATDLRLRQAIRSLDGQMTVFIVSQRTASVRTADRILVLDNGHLAGVGTHDALLRECPVYQEIYYSQYPDERPETGKEAAK